MKSKTTKRSDGRIRAPFVTAEQRSEFYRLYHSEGQPVKEIALKFGLSPVTVSQNIAKFADEIMSVYERKVDMSKLADSERIKALEEENKKLRMELTKSQMRAKFFETMVDIAEQNFNIPIKKKAGTKPPEP